jgi:hypothetical protein
MDIRFSDTLDDAVLAPAVSELTRRPLRRTRRLGVLLTVLGVLLVGLSMLGGNAWPEPFPLLVLVLGVVYLAFFPAWFRRRCLRTVRTNPEYGQARQVHLTDEWLEAATPRTLTRIAWSAFGRVDEAGGVLLLRYGPTVVPIDLRALDGSDRAVLRAHLAALAPVAA